jgi:hypothetical protein
MSDTAAVVEARLTALYQGCSAGARLRMATGLFQSGKRLALAGLRHTAADRHGVALTTALLERLYGDELAPSVRAAVAARAERTR